MYQHKVVKSSDTFFFTLFDSIESTKAIKKKTTHLQSSFKLKVALAQNIHTKVFVCDYFRGECRSYISV